MSVADHSHQPRDETPLVAILGPTASGKSALAMHIAEQFHGEILSCDAVTVYRGMDIGAAKPSKADRTRIPHHCLDLLDADQATTAGDYARAARKAVAEIAGRGRLPILAGGAGLYLRATLDGLAPGPPRDEVLRERLRARSRHRGSAALHRLLRRLDPIASRKIHPNDEPKLIRSLEVTLLARRPQTEQWQTGRDALQGFRVLRIGLDPPRPVLYERINQRAASMFAQGLLPETAEIARVYGEGVRALGGLGYTEALAVLQGRLSLEQAVAAAQQGHRNYAKRQLTWFRREPGVYWLAGFGDQPELQAQTTLLVEQHLMGQAGEGTGPQR